jgi:hypothetical protein
MDKANNVSDRKLRIKFIFFMAELLRLNTRLKIRLSFVK